MSYARKIVLHAPRWDSPLLVAFVEDCVRDGVELVCVVGEDCERVHDVIDELLVGDGSGERPLGPITTWHEGERPRDVMDFASAFDTEGIQRDLVQEVRLGGSR